MEILVIENDFDVIYYKLVIEESNHLKDQIEREKMFFRESFDSLSKVEIERKEKLLNDLNSYLSRFYGDVEEFFQLESIYDYEGAQKACSYLTFAIGIYESALEKAKSNFNIVG